MRRPVPPVGWRWAVLVLLALVLCTTFALLGLDIASLVGLREVQSDALTEGDLPPPPATCNCCVKCATPQAYQCSCCQHCAGCSGQVSGAAATATLNIIGKVEAGGGIPPDTTLAVGNDDDGGRIITVVNNDVVILNKATHTRISAARGFYKDSMQAGDPWVTWDYATSRFFLTALLLESCSKRLTVNSPPAIAGLYCTGAARFGPTSYLLTGQVQVGSPLNGCGPMAPLTGKIALIQRGTCIFSAKVKNAQNAGAIAVIIYNNAGETALTMAGSDPTITIPSIFIGQSNGTAIAANLPVSVTLDSLPEENFWTTIFISVSNTSSPNDRNDFTHYKISDGSYAGFAGDYPKHTTDRDALYIGSQLFGTRYGTFPNCSGANIRALDKAALLSGAGAITLWDATIPGNGITGPQFLSTIDVLPPITDHLLPTLFVGLNTGNSFGYCNFSNPTVATGFVIYAGTASGGIRSQVGFVPFPTPMSFGWCGDALCVGYGPLARQPPPAIPINIESAGGRNYGGVVYKGKLYATMVHNISTTQIVTRWFVIDVSPMARYGQPVLLQWGDLNFSPDIDTYWSRITVNADETFAVVFYSSGPNQHIVASYTFHLNSDAPNSIHTPPRVAVPNDYVYFEDHGSGRVRYGDYVGLTVDPSNKRTFYAFMQRPDPIGLFSPSGLRGPCLNTSECVARDWTTDLFSFDVDADTCPVDGIATIPVVLSSSPLPGGVASVPAAGRSGFALPDTGGGDEEGGAEADE